MTIERILGVNPNEDEVRNEFKTRNLSLPSDEILVEDNNKFHVHGHYSTRSETKEIALMKFAILMNEVA